jgi:hypothetical protein
MGIADLNTHIMGLLAGLLTGLQQYASAVLGS